MRSTGEVMGIDSDFAMAFGKSQLGAGQKLPLGGTVFVSVKESDKDRIIAPVQALSNMGFSIIATRGTKRHLEANGVPCEAINKVLEGRPHVVDAIKNGEVNLVFNTTEGVQGPGRQQGHPALGLASPRPLLYNFSGGGRGHAGN